MKNDLASHLEFFVLLARHGNLSAAARALDLTPPPPPSAWRSSKNTWACAW